MKALQNIDDALALLANAEVVDHNYLPVAAAYCRKLNLVETVNRMVPTSMELQPGLAVQAMVLDVLSGRSPLYHLEYFVSELEDSELLLGERVNAHMFNDTNVGRSLDAVFKAGSSKIITEIGMIASREFALDASMVSYDTTSTNVWGAYSCSDGDEPAPGPVITYGHSKDHRNDLKQFMTELLCVERGVPIFAATRDGASSDKTSNNEMLTRISSIMKRHGIADGAFTYVADSALVTPDNLKELAGIRFVTRLPASYKVCDDVIAEAVVSDAWHEIGKLVESSESDSRPAAFYRARESSVELYGCDYRALVVHSSAHDKRRQKKLAKQLVQSQNQLESMLKKEPVDYACEADATAAAKRLGALREKFHRLKVSVERIECRKRGRPPQNRQASTTSRFALKWEIVEQREAVERLRETTGCFVLLSNVPEHGETSMDAEELLRSYKGQYGVESNFSFLKDPLIVNDLFLKTPSRIDALGMVLVIALTVYRLMERNMRLHLQTTQTTIDGWRHRRTSKPTAYMMTRKVRGIKVAVINGTRHIIRKPGPIARSYLTALGVSDEVFTQPHYRCCPIITGKPPPKR
jgi:transposase